jgi:hypothetical protein
VTPAAFDKAELERLFALTDLRSKATTKAGERDSSEEPRKRLRVLDDRTSQLLAIAFSKLPAPDHLAVMVDQFDNFPEGLTPEAVIALHNAVSEHKDAVDQIRQVAVTQEAIAQLDMPEKFLLRLTAVPFCSVKLACGALLVGQARELSELRAKVKEVGVCSQMIRKSGLLKKFMSTSLAVGNILNRGTARSGVRGVVLPDSLLKLEELRGNMDTGEGGDRSGGSVLDFVTQALVNEDNTDLQKEAENLLLKARFASGTSLEEAEASFRQVSAEVKKIQPSLKEIPESAVKSQIEFRVGRVSEEVGYAEDLSQKVRAELAKTQQWSCCKGQPKSDDWFATWVQFLEIFTRAIVKAQDMKVRLKDEQKKRTTQEEKKMNTPRSEERQARAPCANAARTPLCNVNVEEAQTHRERAKTNIGRASSRGSSASRMKGGCILDDDAKVDLSKVDLSKLLARNAEFPEKENSSR